MDIVEKIEQLCKNKNISISNLEIQLGFSNGSIKKWSKSQPSIDRVLKVAEYFNVSTDYLIGNTKSPTPLNDEDIISIQRAKLKMSSKDQKKMMDILRISFDYAFNENYDDTENDKI